jgi:transcriptional antiterminator NusG
MVSGESSLASASDDASSDRNLNALWYALQVRSRAEKSTAFQLRCRGYEVLLPTWKASHLLNGKPVDVELPVFPGYLFCSFDVTRRLPILTTPGVKAVVSVGRIPAPVDQHEIAHIQKVMQMGLALEPHQYLREGMDVELTSGPLRGLSAKVIRMKDSQRIVLGVTLLQRAVSVEVESHWIQVPEHPWNVLSRNAGALPVQGIRVQ